MLTLLCHSNFSSAPSPTSDVGFEVAHGHKSWWTRVLWFAVFSLVVGFFALLFGGYRDWLDRRPIWGVRWWAPLRRAPKDEQKLKLLERLVELQEEQQQQQREWQQEQQK